MANMELTLPELLEKNGVKLSSLGTDTPSMDKANAEYDKNANEIVHTTQTGFGKEVVPLNVLMSEALDLVPQYSVLLPRLPGDHGSDMPISAKVPVIGEVGLFDGNTEWTTGAGTVREPDKKIATGEVAITQGQFIADVGISKRQLNYSIVDMQSWVRMRFAQSVARTVDAFILNADSTSGATGNVNLDDDTPASTAYYMQGANGVRRTAIAGTALTVDVGTPTFAKLLALLGKVGDFGAAPGDLLWIMNQSTYLAYLGVDEFKKANENGVKSTIFDGSITNILGSDLVTARDLPKTEADGKVSATPASNTKGQIALIHRPSIQYGYGQAPEIDSVVAPGKGITLVSTFEFGFAIAQLLAGQTNSSVALGINVTV